MTTYSPPPKEPIPSKPKDQPKWTFDQKPMLIRDAMRLKIPVKELFEAEGVALSIKWTTLIRVCNDRMKQGQKITLDTTVKDGLEAYTTCMDGVFF